MKEKLMNALYDMDKAAKLFETLDFEIYFLGGAACVLGEYTDRATRDFDFVDLNYSAAFGRVFSLLRDFDMLEYESTLLAPDYKTRAKRLDEIKNFAAYVLSPEDIAVSKIIRLNEKDLKDLDEIMPNCDKTLIKTIIEAIIAREDLYPKKRAGFLENLPAFKERYHV